MTSQQIRRWAAAGVLAGVVALFGCGSEEDAAKAPTPTGTPAQAATPEPSAALPGGLLGSWKRTMTARDWESGGGGFPSGTWRFDVGANGAVDVYLPHTGTVDFSTQFAVKGHQLTIDSVPVCPGRTGRYTWHASSRKLGLTVVSDETCKPRAALFGGTWTHRH